MEEQDVKPNVDAVKPPVPTPVSATEPQRPNHGSPPRSRAGSPSGRRGGGSGRSVSPLTSAGAGHHLVASRALSPQGKRHHSSSRKRKNEESQTAPPEAGRSSSGSTSNSAGAGALHSFKKSRPNTDAGDRRATVKDAEQLPVAMDIDAGDDVKPGTPVPGHPTGLPKHKARGKKKRPEDSGTAQAGSTAAPRPEVSARQGSPAVQSAVHSATPAVSTTPQPVSRDASPAPGATAAAPPVSYHPMRGPLTQEEYQMAILDTYPDKITENEFKELLRGKEKMSVKDIRNHFGKRMKKNPRGILTAKFFSWKLCDGVDGGFTLKKEFK